MEKYDQPTTNGRFLTWIGFDIEFELTWCHVNSPLLFFLISLYIFLIYDVSINKVLQGCSNCDVPLVLLERFWWFKFNGIYVVRFGFRMWNNVEKLSSCYFVMGSHLQVQYSIQVNAFAFIFDSQKIMSHVVSTLNYNEFTLGPMAEATLVIMDYQSLIIIYLSNL
jgi:hypothetical protein